MEVAPGDMRTDVLTECQAAADDGSFVHALAGFIRWLAADYQPDYHDFLRWVADLRSQATKVHSRTPGIVADLYAGFDLLSAFAVAAGAITDEQKDEVTARCWQALNQVARAQRVQQESSEPAARFMELLRAAILCGEAHAATTYGNPPEDGDIWGWTVVGSGDKQRSVAKGRCIGWLDAPDLYLEPVASYAVAQELGRKTGEPLVVSETTLKKRLKEKGMLASTDATRETLTVRRKIQGRHIPVLHLRAANVGFSAGDVESMSGF